VAARVEDGVEVGLGEAVQAHRRCELSGRGLIGLKAAGEVGLEVRLVALGVQRRLSALGRGQGDLRAGVRERVVRRRELFQPETSLLAGVAQLVVRGQDHEDLHTAP